MAQKKKPVEKRILDAAATMPFAPKEMPNGDLESVADYLESLKVALEEVERDETANERELSGLNADLAATGRLLRRMGVIPGDDQ